MYTNNTKCDIVKLINILLNFTKKNTLNRFYRYSTEIKL